MLNTNNYLYANYNVYTKFSAKVNNKGTQKKKIELLRSEEELPKRRRSPRLTANSTLTNSDTSGKSTETTILNNKENSSSSHLTEKHAEVEAEVVEENNIAGTTRQRHQRPTKAKDAEKDVKLPLIEDKGKATNKAPARKGKKKAGKAKMDISFDVIEELVPPLVSTKSSDFYALNFCIRSFYQNNTICIPLFYVFILFL